MNDEFICFFVVVVVIDQAQQVGLLTKNHHYIILSLDAHTIDLEPFQYSGTNFTLLRMVNPASPLMESFSEYMKGINSEEDDAADVNHRSRENNDDENDETQNKGNKDENKDEQNEVSGALNIQHLKFIIIVKWQPLFISQRVLAGKRSPAYSIDLRWRSIIGRGVQTNGHGSGATDELKLRRPDVGMEQRVHSQWIYEIGMRNIQSNSTVKSHIDP